MDSKLKCLFLLPESNGGVDEGLGANRESWLSSGGIGAGDSGLNKVIWKVKLFGANAQMDNIRRFQKQLINKSNDY